MKKSIYIVTLFCITVFMCKAASFEQEKQQIKYHVSKSHRLGTTIRARKKIDKSKTLQRQKERQTKSSVNHPYCDYKSYQ